jgi:hypothetical protein
MISALATIMGDFDAHPDPETLPEPAEEAEPDWMPGPEMAPA